MKIIQDKSFKDLTTFNIGGRIKYLAEVKNTKEVDEAVCFAKKNKLPIFIIGGGSDFLAGDGEYEGMVIKYIGSSISYIGQGVVKAEAGLSWDNLVKDATEKNLQGIECLSGIPGTVGAAPIQNIGAYGQELKDTFVKLTAFDIEKEEFVEFNKEDCKFGYRESVFKEKSNWQKYIITDITLKLNKGGKPVVSYESLNGKIKENPTLADVREAIIQVRGEKLEDPKKIGNAGSFFKNPVINSAQKEKLEKEFPEIKIFPFGEEFKISAAWLIETAGWKGKHYKNAAVSAKHALILVNPEGKTTASEELELSDKIIEDVNKKFGIKLEREVQLVNF